MKITITFDAPRSHPVELKLNPTAPATKLDVKIQKLVRISYPFPPLSYSVVYAHIPHDLTTDTKIGSLFIENAHLTVVSISKLTPAHWVKRASQYTDLLSLSPLAPVARSNQDKQPQLLARNWENYSALQQANVLGLISKQTGQTVSIYLSSKKDRVVFYLNDPAAALAKAAEISLTDFLETLSGDQTDSELLQLSPIAYGDLSGTASVRKSHHEVTPFAAELWRNYLIALGPETLGEHLFSLGEKIRQNPMHEHNDELQTIATYILDLGGRISDEEALSEELLLDAMKTLDNCILLLNQLETTTSATASQSDQELPFEMIPLDTSLTQEDAENN
jgi:hypothetical protein